MNWALSSLRLGPIGWADKLRRASEQSPGPRASWALTGARASESKIKTHGRQELGLALSPSRPYWIIGSKRAALRARLGALEQGGASAAARGGPDLAAHKKVGGRMRHALPAVLQDLRRLLAGLGPRSACFSARYAQAAPGPCWGRDGPVSAGLGLAEACFRPIPFICEGLGWASGPGAQLMREPLQVGPDPSPWPKEARNLGDG